MLNSTRGSIKVFLGVFFLMIGLGGGLFIFAYVQSQQTSLDVYGEVPAFEFIDQNSEPFGRDDLTGKISVVDFIFTNCPGVCPTMSARMAELYEAYADQPLVQFVSISVDPARDSLHVLQEYAKEHGVTDNRWRFLREENVQKVIDLSEKGFFLPAENLPMGHSSKFVLVDAAGLIRGYYNSFDTDRLRQLRADIHALLKRL
ncbi:MAG: SCO family protein [Gemmatimonadetes bacterium]|nr:MAG: SCO family protein [Gemmatimonadota bacterium]